MRRPGNISGFNGIRPRKNSLNLSGFGNYDGYLGNFGKGMIAPPPGAPTGPGVPLPGAVNAQTGQPYLQDPACPQGEKTETRNIPCQGDECCDIVGTMRDCDPEGTPYPETDCFADPAYKSLPKPPPPPPPAAMVQQATPQQASAQAQPQMSAEDEAAEAAEAARLQTELMQLEAQQSQVESMVTQAPTLPLPSSYTGSSMPVMTTRQTPATPTTEQQIASLVSAHETQKAIQRSSAPPPIARTVPAPVIRTPAPTPVPVSTASSQVTTAIPKLFSWLKGALFGSSGSDFDGWELGNVATSKSIIPLLVGVAIIFFMLKKKKTAA